MKKILSLLLCVIFVFACFVTVYAEDLDGLKDEREALEAQRDEIQGDLDRKNAEVDSKQKDVDEIVEKVKSITADITESHKKIDKLSESIEKKQLEIAEKNLEIEKDMDTLRGRIKRLFKSKGQSTVELVLGASDFDEFLDDVQIARYVAVRDEQLIAQVKGEIVIVNEEKDELQTEKLEQEKEEQKLEEKQEELNTTLEENKEVLATLQQESNGIMNQLALTDEQLADLEDEIQAQQEILARQNSNYSGGSTHSSGMDIDIDIPDDGSWVWPTPGAYMISSDFYDSEGRSSMHGALDIAGGYGTPVVAVKDGYVEYVCDCCYHNWGKFYNCGCGGGYGNYIQIDHGSGYEVIYAHLQSVCVGSGESVSAGQVIGYMGSTGHSTGAHLHFEARYNGSKFDPQTKY